jgi:RNA polymerase sigma factor (TIGR02999 family)
LKQLTCPQRRAKEVAIFATCFALAKHPIPTDTRIKRSPSSKFLHREFRLKIKGDGKWRRLAMIWRMNPDLAPGVGINTPELMAVAYEELRRIARSARASNGRGFNTTTLVHEAYLKLCHYSGVESLEHLKSIAARAMRQIIVDHLRHQRAQKRGGAAVEDSLGDIALPVASNSFDLLLVDQALHHIESIDPRLASIVDMIVFAGMTMAEIASVVGLTERTVFRDWRKARAILSDYLSLGETP